MRYEVDGLDILAAASGSPAHCESAASAMCKCEPCRNRSGLAWPPDALTRLLMDADRVPDIVLERLLQRIAAAQAEDIASVVTQTGPEIVQNLRPPKTLGETKAGKSSRP
jgi:hypothetical protein